MIDLTKKTRLALAISAAIALAACNGDDGKNGSNGNDGEQGPTGAAGATGPQGEQGEQGDAGENGTDAGLMTAGLTRLGTVPAGAEVTGAFLTEDGDLFFNVQHPDDTNTEEDAAGQTFGKGTVGVVTGVNFNNLPKNLVSVHVPKTDVERQTVQLAYGEYQVLTQAGDTYNSLNGGIARVYKDGNIVKTPAGEDSLINDPDFNGFVPTGENEGYLFTNWESVMGGVSRMKLTKNATSGMWSVDSDDVMMVDFGEWGTVANCFGSVSPWGTPLTSEEWGGFGDNTHEWNNPDNEDKYGNRDAFAKYTSPEADSAAEATKFPNTYQYHYIVEITDATEANPVPVKHYTMGRFTHENAIVMPDRKTVYLSDDETNGVLFKFIADTAEDLSAGTLYAAKLTQDAGSKEPLTTGFDVEWVELAHGTNAEIKGWIDEYNDINYDSFTEGKSNYLTDADAMAWAAGDAKFPSASTAYSAAANAGFEGANTFGGSVTAGEDMDDRVAFLESRKAAKAKGATAEWRKLEGIYINQKRAEEAVEGTDLIPGKVIEDAYVYFAIADLDKGLIDDEGHVQLSSRVKDCGGVYRMKLLAGYDTDRIEPVVMGSTYRSTMDGAKRCDVNALSQPDNVIVMDDGRIIIGEDGFQENNTLWMYDPSVND